MAQAAEWVEQILEEGGKAAALVAAFAQAFPPEARWGEPWAAPVEADEPPPPFAPSAASYAAALREVLAGRRRLRLDGRWDDGEPGTVTAIARPHGWVLL